MMPGIFSATPAIGDVVRLTAPTESGLFASDLPAGIVGVVVGVTGRRLMVEVDDGFSSVRVGVRASACRVLSRGKGVDRFRRGVGRRRAVRVGALLLIALPFGQYVISWWIATGSLDGLVEGLPLAALESGAAFVSLAFGDPLRAALTIALGWLTWRLAFGRR